MGWVVNTTPRPLYPRQIPGTHCIGGGVGARAGLDACRKSRPHRDSIPGLLKLAEYIYIKLLDLTRLHHHRTDNFPFNTVLLTS
jgi:hypothetical protein